MKKSKVQFKHLFGLIVIAIVVVVLYFLLHSYLNIQKKEPNEWNDVVGTMTAIAIDQSTVTETPLITPVTTPTISDAHATETIVAFETVVSDVYTYEGIFEAEEKFYSENPEILIRILKRQVPYTSKVFDITLTEEGSFFVRVKKKPYYQRTGEVKQWFYKKGVRDFSQIDIEWFDDSDDYLPMKHFKY